MSAAVKRLPSETKSEAEELLNFLKNAYARSSQEAATLIDNLDAPNIEHIKILEETLASITPEMIEELNAITTVVDAENSETRAEVNNKVTPLGRLISELLKYTKIAADSDRTLYSKFWQLQDKYTAVNSAIGMINRETVRHT